jgi:hypothetical protein
LPWFSSATDSSREPIQRGKDETNLSPWFIIVTDSSIEQLHVERKESIESILERTITTAHEISVYVL